MNTAMAYTPVCEDGKHEWRRIERMHGYTSTATVTGFTCKICGITTDAFNDQPVKPPPSPAIDASPVVEREIHNGPYTEIVKIEMPTG